MPFTGESTDSDSDGANPDDLHHHHGAENLARGTATATTTTSSRATTSSTSGDISLTSPRQPGPPSGATPSCTRFPSRLSLPPRHHPSPSPSPSSRHPDLHSSATPLLHKSKLGRLLEKQTKKPKKLFLFKIIRKLITSFRLNLTLAYSDVSIIIVSQICNGNLSL